MKQNLGKRPSLFMPRHGEYTIDNWIIIDRKMVIGRSLDVDILLQNPEVGDRHCFILPRENQVFLTEMIPSKGTFVNGLRLTPGSTIMLEDGDNILIGGLNLRFYFKTVSEIQAARLLKKNPYNVDLSETALDELPPPIPSRKDDRVEWEESALTKETLIKESDSFEPPSFNSINSLKEEQGINKKNERSPSPFWRLGGFLLDLFFGLTLLLSFKGHPLFLSAEHVIKVFIKELYTTDKTVFIPWGGRDLVLDIFVFLLFLLIYRMVAHLFFGVSFGAFVMGMGGGDSFIWNRVGGVIRAMVGWITMPLFFLFDIPLFFRRRSWREWFSMTHVIQHSFWRGGLSFLLFVPLFFSFVLLWPFYWDTKWYQGIPLKGYEENDLLVNLNVPSNSQVVKSLHFHWSFKSYSYEDMILIPSFDVVKKGVFKKISPLLVIYNKKHSVLGSIRADEVSRLGVILFESSQKILFFHRHYPALANYFSGIKKKEIAQKSFLFPPLSPPVVLDIQKMIKRSLELNPKQLPQLILEGTPFNYGYAYLRQNLLFGLVSWKSSGAIEAELFAWGNQLFLSLKQVGKNPRAEGEDQRYFFSLQSLNSPLFELSWERGPRVVKAERDFMRSINAELTWYFDTPIDNDVPLPSDENSVDDYFAKLDIFDIVDFFGLQKTSEEVRRSLEQYLYSYCFSLAKEALKRGDEKELRVIHDHLERIQMVVIALFPQKSTSSFMSSLKDLQRAISDRNTQYFAPQLQPVEAIDQAI